MGDEFDEIPLVLMLEDDEVDVYDVADPLLLLLDS